MAPPDSHTAVPLATGRILVTGAGGFVGRALTMHLMRQGVAVTAVVRHPPPGLPFAVTQVTRYEDMAGLMPGHDCLVHLAARVHVMRDATADPLAAFRAANTTLSASLAHSAAAAGLRRMVYLSSVKVNGEETRLGQAFGPDDACFPQDPYAVSKMEAERLLRHICADTGLELVIVRPPLVYGAGVAANFAALVRAVRRGLPLPLGAIDNRRSLVSLDNLVDFLGVCSVHLAAAGQTFLVSDGEDLSTPELVRRLAACSGRRARLVSIPVDVLVTLAALLGRRKQVRRLTGSLQVDISKNAALLGWTPVSTVDEGLAKVMRGMKQ